MRYSKVLLDKTLKSGAGLLLWCAASFIGYSAEKQAVPAKADLAVAEEKIKSTFKEDFAKPGPENKQSLLKTLLETAREDNAPPAERYGCFTLATSLAVQVGDGERVCQTIDELDRVFVVDRPTLKLEALTKLTQTIPNVEAARTLASLCLDAWQQALDADRHEVAQKLIGLAQSMASRLNDAAFTAQVAAKKKETADLLAEYTAVKPASLKLIEKPDDPEACLMFGRYLALIKNNFETGLPLLAKCADAGLKKAANADDDAQAASADGVGKLALAAGDAWWDVGVTAKQIHRDAVLLRSALWYGKALPSLAGIDRVRVEKRLEACAAVKNKPGLLPVRKFINLFPEGDFEFTNIKAVTGSLIDGEISVSKDAKSGNGACFINGTGRFIKDLADLHLKGGTTYWVGGSVKIVKPDGGLGLAVTKNILEILGIAIIGPGAGNAKAGEWAPFKFKFTMPENGKVILAFGKFEAKDPPIYAYVDELTISEKEP